MRGWRSRVPRGKPPKPNRCDEDLTLKVAKLPCSAGAREEGKAQVSRRRVMRQRPRSTLSICRTNCTPRLSGVRQSRRATLTVLQARSFLSCWSFPIAPRHWCTLPSLGRTLLGANRSCRRGITRTSSTACGIHWRLEPFGVGVRWAAVLSRLSLSPVTWVVSHQQSLCKHDRARS